MLAALVRQNAHLQPYAVQYSFPYKTSNQLQPITAQCVCIYNYIYIYTGKSETEVPFADLSLWVSLLSDGGSPLPNNSHLRLRNAGRKPREKGDG